MTARMWIAATSLADEHRLRAENLRQQAKALRARPLSPMRQRLQAQATLYDKTAKTLDGLRAKYGL